MGLREDSNHHFDHHSHRNDPTLPQLFMIALEGSRDARASIVSALRVTIYAVERGEKCD